MSPSQAKFGLEQIKTILGSEYESLSNHKPKFDLKNLTQPSADFVDKVYLNSDRSNRVMQNLQTLYDHGNLGKTGYLSILAVDQGVEHFAKNTFAKNTAYFDPEEIIKLAIDGGCNAITSTLGILGLVSRKYAHHIPFIVKLNHNQSLTYPIKYDQVMFAQVKQAWNLGAVGVGATVFFGSRESDRQIQEVAKAFAEAHKLGMFTVLWCYLRNSNFVKRGKNYQYSADLTGQANYLGATLQADIIKQKMPKLDHGYSIFEEAKTLKINDYQGSQTLEKTKNTNTSHNTIHNQNLDTDHPVDLTRQQVMSNYLGKIPLINSGDASGQDDLYESTRSALINKLAGGSGLIVGRKVFQKPKSEGLEILSAIQSVFLNSEIQPK